MENAIGTDSLAIQRRDVILQVGYQLPLHACTIQRVLVLVKSSFQILDDISKPCALRSAFHKSLDCACDLPPFIPWVLDAPNILWVAHLDSLLTLGLYPVVVKAPVRDHQLPTRLWSAGVGPIILGPGRLETARTAEESVSFYRVPRAAQLYLNFALSL